MTCGRCGRDDSHRLAGQLQHGGVGTRSGPRQHKRNQRPKPWVRLSAGQMVLNPLHAPHPDRCHNQPKDQQQIKLEAARRRFSSTRRFCCGGRSSSWLGRSSSWFGRGCGSAWNRLCGCGGRLRRGRGRLDYCGRGVIARRCRRCFPRSSGSRRSWNSWNDFWNGRLLKADIWRIGFLDGRQRVCHLPVRHAAFDLRFCAGNNLDMTGYPSVLKIDISKRSLVCTKQRNPSHKDGEKNSKV